MSIIGSHARSKVVPSVGLGAIYASPDLAAALQRGVAITITQKTYCVVYYTLHHRNTNLNNKQIEPKYQCVGA